MNSVHPLDRERYAAMAVLKLEKGGYGFIWCDECRAPVEAAGHSAQGNGKEPDWHIEPSEMEP